MAYVRGASRAAAPIVAIALLCSAGAGAAQGATANVEAGGNPVTGNLRFDPPVSSVAVGDTVRWTNTDVLVPHTATEDHRLWELTGTYGATPATPPGFGPAESRERVFEAGTWSYFCAVHTEMRGIVVVPVTLRVPVAKKNKKKASSAGAGGRRLIAIWATAPLPAGQVFDVQLRRGKRSWKTVREGTTALRGRFRLTKRRRLSMRARVRMAGDPSQASGYSPPVSITLR